MQSNLYVITGVGQMRNVCGYIEQYGAVDNYAVVLYTPINYAVVQNLRDSGIDDKFKSVYYLELPERFSEEQLVKSVKIYHRFDNMLKTMKRKYEIQNLFLCMPTGHYSFMGGLAKKYKLSINLLEEGLATYRVFVQEQDAKQKVISPSDIKWRLSVILQPVKIVLRYIVDILLLPVDCISMLSKKDLSYYIKRFIKKCFRYKYGIIEKFDHTYVCFPDKLDPSFLKKNDVEKLNFNYTNDPWRFTDGDEDNVLFVNQQYIGYKKHFQAVFSIFRDMGLKKVYIKFHPKEDLNSFRDILNDYIRMYRDIEIIPLMEGANIPVENLLVTNKISKVIGLSSSTLFFAPIVKPDIETVCIADEYYRRCLEDGVSEKQLEMFYQDKTMIERIFDVDRIELKLENGQKDDLFRYLEEKSVAKLQ